jgi:non-ribosomal peptide synthetase component E (peptide arylation enzyme)
MLKATQYQVREPMPGVVYAPAHELREYVDAGLLTQETMGDAFRSSCKLHAYRMALVSAEVQYTYAQLDEATDRLGAAYLALGLKPLDRVVFQIANCPELIICFYACLKAGLIPICTLAAHREQEIGYLGNHAAARMHFVQGDDPKFDENDPFSKKPKLKNQSLIQQKMKNQVSKPGSILELAPKSESGQPAIINN